MTTSQSNRARRTRQICCCLSLLSLSVACSLASAAGEKRAKNRAGKKVKPGAENDQTTDITAKNTTGGALKRQSHVAEPVGTTVGGREPPLYHRL